MKIFIFTNAFLSNHSACKTEIYALNARLMLKSHISLNLYVYHQQQYNWVSSMATTIEFLLLVVRRTLQCEIHAFGRTVLLLLLLLFLRLTHSFNNTLVPIEWSHFAVCLLNQILCMNVSQFSAHVSSYLFLIQLFRQENIKIIYKVVEKSLSLSAHQARAFATLEASRSASISSKSVLLWSS